MKTIFSASFVFATLMGLNTYAQNEAIPTWQDLWTATPGQSGAVYSPNVVAYINGGAGFAFSPNASIEVTALGYGIVGTNSASYQESLFDASGNQLARATVTTGDSFYNQSFYESISPINLTAGDTYYLQSVEIPGNPWVGDVSSVFSVNSYITYLSSASGGFGEPLTQLGSPAYYFEAPNFEFVPVPEPSVLALSVAGLLGLAWRRR